MFYERFVELCKIMGMSPSAVARDIGLSNSSTTTWKRGSVPKGETLETIADYFSTTVDYLLGRTDDPENSDRFGLDLPEFWQTHLDDKSPDDKVWLSKEQRELHDMLDIAFRNLNQLGQQKAVERVEELTEIPRYRLQEAPQPIPHESEGKDTPAPEKPGEGPPEGE